MKHKADYFPQYLNNRIERKVKTICEHCGKKQTSEEINCSLNYVSCKKCGKEGALKELK